MKRLIVIGLLLLVAASGWCEKAYESFSFDYDGRTYFTRVYTFRAGAGLDESWIEMEDEPRVQVIRVPSLTLERVTDIALSNYSEQHRTDKNTWFSIMVFEIGRTDNMLYDFMVPVWVCDYKPNLYQRKYALWLEGEKELTLYDSLSNKED